MQLLVINGSPRGKKSNSKIIIDALFPQDSIPKKWTFKTEYITDALISEALDQSIIQANLIFLVFPLYTDSLPGIVTRLIEKFKDLSGEMEGKKFGFIVQSGFPEVHHSTFIQTYMVRLIGRLKCIFIGSAIFGGIEGIQSRPLESIQDFKDTLRQIGKIILEEGRVDKELVKSIKQPYKFPRLVAGLVKIVMKIKKGQSFWDNQLKSNHAYELRFDQPFLPKS